MAKFRGITLVGALFAAGVAVTARAEPRLAVSAGEDGAVESARQCDVYVTGQATGGDGRPLVYQWRDGTSPLGPWTALRADGTAPLELCGLSVGRHVLTLEVTDGARTASDRLVATVKPSAPTGIASTEARPIR